MTKTILADSTSVGCEHGSTYIAKYRAHYIN